MSEEQKPAGAFIKSLVTEGGGAAPPYDVLTLQDGRVVVISDEGIGLYTSLDMFTLNGSPINLREILPLKEWIAKVSIHGYFTYSMRVKAETARIASDVARLTAPKELPIHEGMHVEEIVVDEVAETPAEAPNS